MGEVLIWAGAGLALAGFAGVLWCLVQAMKLRRAALRGDDPSAELRRLVSFNLASVAVAFLGLGVMIVGAVL